MENQLVRVTQLRAPAQSGPTLIKRRPENQIRLRDALIRSRRVRLCSSIPSQG